MKYNNLLESDRDLKKPKILLGYQYGGHLDSAIRAISNGGSGVCMNNNRELKQTRRRRKRERHMKM